jgi:hypothetical protein
VSTASALCWRLFIFWETNIMSEQLDFDVVLGGFTFQDFEIPATICWGGHQQNVVLDLIGGQRVVDAMGYQPADIEWAGRFRGPNALPRAQQLEQMTQQGAQLPLSWGGLFYTVLIDTFHADFMKPYEIPYTLRLVVVNDPANQPAAPRTTLDQLVANDMAAALAALS